MRTLLVVAIMLAAAVGQASADVPDSAFAVVTYDAFADTTRVQLGVRGMIGSTTIRVAGLDGNELKDMFMGVDFACRGEAVRRPDSVSVLVVCTGEGASRYAGVRAMDLVSGQYRTAAPLKVMAGHDSDVISMAFMTFRLATGDLSRATSQRCIAKVGPSEFVFSDPGGPMMQAFARYVTSLPKVH